jgi:hypothetical protein
LIVTSSPDLVRDRDEYAIQRAATSPHVSGGGEPIGYLPDPPFGNLACDFQTSAGCASTNSHNRIRHYLLPDGRGHSITLMTTNSTS